MSEPRIRPPAKYQALLDKLVHEDGLFETKQAVLMFAAALGKYYNRREAVDKFGEGIRWDIFTRRDDDHFINLMALAETESLEVLDEQQNEEHHVAIFEAYAAGGLAILEERYLNQPGDLLDNLLVLMAQAKTTEVQMSSGLEGLTPAALDALVGGL